MEDRIAVKDFEVHDLVKGMAEALGVDYMKEHNELCLEIPEALGKGYINAVSFSHGVGIIDLDVILNREVQLEMSKSHVQPLKLIYNRESTFEHRFEGKPEVHKIERLECIMTSCNTSNYHLLHLPANQSICLFAIEINRKLFEEKIEGFLPAMNREMETLFRDVNGINLFFYQGFYSLEIAKNIEECTECDLTDLPRAVYLEGKAYEILGHQLRQYVDDLDEPGKRKILRQATKDRIEEAAEIIREELESVGNVISLAKRVGLNQNTLQSGFRHLFGTSVNTFIKNTRLEKAKELLESSDMNISEITYAIGINSRSYFSKLFKEKYGLTPRNYLNSLNGRDNSKSA